MPELDRIPNPAHAQLIRGAISEKTGFDWYFHRLPPTRGDW